MDIRTKIALAVTTIAGLSCAAIVLVPQAGAGATPALKVQEANPTITITNQGGDQPYSFSPAQLNAKAGQAITVTNNDANGVHNVTAKDHSFSVDVPPKGSATLTIPKPGNYDYFCTYHTDSHNQASITVS
jgi:plastocyanin